jgi:protein-disulfide isomerase
VLVEFYDYSCGYCKKVFPSVAKLIEEDKNLKVVFKEFPILGPNSVITAKAALAANIIAPEKYLEVHEKLMNSRITSKENLIDIVSSLGIDKDKLSSEMESDKVQKIIDDNKDLARDLGISGTPAFVIGDEFVPGAVSFEQMKEIIKQQREKNSASNETEDK